MARSLKASSVGIAKANQALIGKALTQEALADQIDIHRQTVNKFFQGRAVDRVIFINICEALDLSWEAIIEPSPASNPTPASNIDELVQRVRQQCHEKIQALYGTMQLLDIAQPIDVNHIYVEVNILEQITSQQWQDIADLVQPFNPETDDFDRLGLPAVKQKRVAGLEVVNKYPKLMVLGKPGAGKTTFLQHLAIQCDAGQFLSDRVPILIQLKTFTKHAKDDFGLIDYINREFCSCGITEPEVAEQILTHGRGFILLDGLDEIPAKNEDQIIEQIQQFAQDFFKNQLIITCRIAAHKYRFHGFTEVEVADFNKQQVQAFAEKWFAAMAGNDLTQGSSQANQFMAKLNLPQNRQIRDLAITPILLHLTCLVFQAKAEFPTNRAKLYEQGLDILLVKWDASRGIKRDTIYQRLTLENKKKLLSQIAYFTFERGEYFFEKPTLQDLISNYLEKQLTHNTEELQPNTEAILQAIEAQHGLLVERAREIYSFSHLTFQEYFTAKAIADYPNPEAFKQLVNHIAEKRWREVFLLATSLLHPADQLLCLMQQQVNQLIASDTTLQKFLNWVSRKALSVEAPYKREALRAFYFCYELDYIQNRNRLGYRKIDPALIFSLTSALDSTLKIPLDLLINLRFFDEFEQNLAIDIILDLLLSHALDLSLPYIYAGASYRDLHSTLIYGIQINLNSGLTSSLEQLQVQLPLPEMIQEKQEWWRVERTWWKANGQAWTDQLRAILIQYRDIGHVWRFTDQQKQLLNQYINATRLLVDCLQSGCQVTPAIREAIEETLLLPICSSTVELASPDGLAE